MIILKLENTGKLFNSVYEENGKTRHVAMINTETRWKYVALSVFLGLLMNGLKNTIHELSHAVIILLSGGKISAISIQLDVGFVRWVAGSVPEADFPLIYIAGIAGECLFFFIPGIIIFKHNRNDVRIAIAGYWMVMLYQLSLFYWFVGSFYPIFQYYDSIGFSNGIGINPGIMGVISAIPVGFGVLFSLRCTTRLQKQFLLDGRKIHVFTIFLVYFLILLVIKMILPIA